MLTSLYVRKNGMSSMNASLIAAENATLVSPILHTLRSSDCSNSALTVSTLLMEPKMVAMSARGRISRPSSTALQATNVR